MDRISTVQRDFRKAESRLRSLISQAPDDPVIRLVQEQLLSYRHVIVIYTEASKIGEITSEMEICGKVLKEYEFRVENVANPIQKDENAIYSEFVVCDSAFYESTYGGTHEVDEMSVVIIDGTEEESKEIKRKFRLRRKLYFHIEENTLPEWLITEEWFIKFLFDSVSAYFERMILICQKVLDRKKIIAKGNMILNHSLELDNSDSKVKQLQRSLMSLKQQTTNLVREEFSGLEVLAHDYFNPEGKYFEKVFGDLQGYQGFDEVDDNRNTVFSMPKDYIALVKNNVKEQVYEIVSKLAEGLDRKKHEIKQLVDKEISREEIGLNFEEKPFRDDSVMRALEREEGAFKDYEKRVPKKGIFQLLMELRTPLYVIFPLFIVARFISTSDEGSINEHITTMGGESVVAVSQMPESYKNNKSKFISEINKYLNNGDLVNESTGQEIFKYSVDKRGSRKDVVFSIIEGDGGADQIILPVLSDRRLAVELLEEHVLKLRKRFNVISELQRIPMLFGPFRGLFGPVVVIALLLYMRSRKNKMSREKITIRRREQKALVEDFKRDLSRFASVAETTFQNQLRAYTRSYSDGLNGDLDRQFARKMKQEEHCKSQQAGLIKARHRNLESQVKSIDALHKHFNELDRECAQSIRQI